MLIEDFGCLLIDNSRSKAYLQKLLNNSFVPGLTIYVDMPKSLKKKDEQIFSDIAFLICRAYQERKYFLYEPALKSNSLQENTLWSPKKYASFNPHETVLETIRKHALNHHVITVPHINDEQLVALLARSKPTFFLFGGGGILKKSMLDSGKKFLHIHPGMIPFFRGSHCIEWSVLLNKTCAATAFFMSEIIDGGEILAQQKFDFPELEHGSIPPLYSSHIRSELLLEVIRDYTVQGRFSTVEQNLSEGETYYKMHPALTNLVFHTLSSAKKEGGKIST